MTTSPRPRAPVTWVGAMLGLTAQTVVTTWIAVVFFVEAAAGHRRAEDEGGFARDGFVDDVGAFFTLLGAVLVTGVAILLLLAVVLSRRPGGRRLAGLVVTLVLQVPLVWAGVVTWRNGVAVGEAVVLVAAALVLLAVVDPRAWRWTARSAAPHSVDAPGPPPVGAR